MLKVIVKGLEFRGHHGVTTAEREVGHRFLANIDVELPATACETDDVADTVSYADLARLMLSVSEANRYKTVEALAKRFADEAMAQWPIISRLHIQMIKRMPPADIIAEGTGIELTVSR